VDKAINSLYLCDGFLCGAVLLELLWVSLVAYVGFFVGWSVSLLDSGWCPYWILGRCFVRVVIGDVVGGLADVVGAFCQTEMGAYV
jgi:hypothetical protein